MGSDLSMLYSWARKLPTLCLLSSCPPKPRTQHVIPAKGLFFRSRRGLKIIKLAGRMDARPDRSLEISLVTAPIKVK